MMVARAFIAFLLYNVGVTGIVLMTGLGVFGAMRVRNISPKIIWTIYTNSCS
jgi:hypothetical protein